MPLLCAGFSAQKTGVTSSLCIPLPRVFRPLPHLPHLVASRAAAGPPAGGDGGQTLNQFIANAGKDHDQKVQQEQQEQQPAPPASGGLLQRFKNWLKEGKEQRQKSELQQKMRQVSAVYSGVCMLSQDHTHVHVTDTHTTHAHTRARSYTRTFTHTHEHTQHTHHGRT